MKFFYSALLLFLFYSCSGQPAAVSPDDFEKAITGKDVQVLDVRTAGEFAGGHLKNALSADWNNPAQFKERVAYLDKNKPVYVYCLVGGRSSAAATWLKNNGFTQVVDLAGGIRDWKKAGKPVEAPSAEKQMTIEEYWTNLPTDKTVLVDFGADWCPPCVKMKPVMDELQKDSSVHFQLIKIDAGVHTNVMTTLGISPIPSFIIYKNGKETWRKEGIVSKEELVSQLK